VAIAVLTIVIVFIGLLLILNSLAGWIFSYTIKSFPSPFPPNAWYGSKYMSSHQVGMIVVTLVVLILVFLFFRFTPLGLAMRAAAQNPVSSRLVGMKQEICRRFLGRSIFQRKANAAFLIDSDYGEASTWR
jgi:branched-chain amino acid transport system permease protein